MKTIFRNLGLGFTLAVVGALTPAATLAQDAAPKDDPACIADIEGKQALYKQFTDNFDKKEVEKKKIAVTAGKQYVEKYAACSGDKEINAYINGQIPSLEASIKKIEGNVVKDALLTRFDTAAKAKNTAEVFASGKEILAKEADFGNVALDVAITLAVAGFQQATAATPVDTYNNDAITYAKNAIQKIEAGKTSKSWGVWSYNLKPATADAAKFADEKSYALGALNYIIGNVAYYRQGKDNPEKKKEALASFYKSAQYNSLSKTDPTVYQAIGAWYLDEAIKIDKERQAKLTANANKDNDETLLMVANQKGYADRSIDAYSRAYKIAKDDKTQKKEYVDSLYTRLKELYAFRYDGKTEGIDAFVATVQSKPMPDPAVTVTPVKEEVPAATPTTSTTSDTTAPATTKPAATPTTTPVKPTTAPMTKPVSTTVTPAKTEAKESVEATADTKTKKPAPKKKGTR